MTKIEDMTVKELIATAGKHLGEEKAEDGSKFQIVVLDRGFVYVGRVLVFGEWVKIRDARNIRIWGTTEGLGQLALGGPRSGTKLDPVGNVSAPLRALIQLIDTDEKRWE